MKEPRLFSLHPSFFILKQAVHPRSFVRYAFLACPSRSLHSTLRVTSTKYITLGRDISELSVGNDYDKLKRIGHFFPFLFNHRAKNLFDSWSEGDDRLRSGRIVWRGD
jgi:hypothetical protein